MAKGIPSEIDGVQVLQVGSKPVVVRGESWVTLIPYDPEDSRIWEFSLTSGRLLQTAD